MSDFVAPNTDRVQGRQIENPLISKNHKRKRGSDSSSDCTLTIEGADTSWGTCLPEIIRLVQAKTPTGRAKQSWYHRSVQDVCWNRDCDCIFTAGLSGMITIRCICTDKAQMWILRFSYLYYRRNPVASGEWFDSIPHFFVQKMHRLLSCLKYQGRVLQEEREDKKNEYDCFNG